MNNELDLKSKLFLDLVSANVVKARMSKALGQLSLQLKWAIQVLHTMEE